jgi:hypothetical protein
MGFLFCVKRLVIGPCLADLMTDTLNLRLNLLGACLTDEENLNTEFRRTRTENHGELR